MEFGTRQRVVRVVAKETPPTFRATRSIKVEVEVEVEVEVDGEALGVAEGPVLLFFGITNASLVQKSFRPSFVSDRVSVRLWGI